MKQKKLSQQQIQDLLCKMFPDNYRQKELDLVANAAKDSALVELSPHVYELFAYCKEHRLCDYAVISMIETCPQDWVLDYVRDHLQTSASMEVAYALIRSKNLPAIRIFLRERCYPLSDKVIDELMKLEYQDSYPIFVEMGMYPVKLQRLAKKLPLKTVFNLIKDTEDTTGRHAHLIFIKRLMKRDLSLLEDFMSSLHNSLEDKAEAFFIARAPTQLIKAYLQKQWILCEEAEIALAKRKERLLIRAYLHSHCFNSPDAVHHLVKSGYEEEIRIQLNARRIPDYSKDVQRYILLHCSEATRKLLLEKVALCQTVQELFIKRCSIDEFKEYLEWHDLCIETQKFLVFHGKHDLIMAYLDRRTANCLLQVLLIRRGQHDEIMAMIQKGLCREAVEMLIKRGMREEIQAFLYAEQIKHFCTQNK